MTSPWPAICVFLALAVLLALILRWKMQAFTALLVASLGLGLAAGMPPDQVVDGISKGIGEILRDVALLLALGAMLGRMLEASGAAEVIAATLLRWFGPRAASLAVLAAGFLIGIPVLFNVGFLLLLPITYRLQRQSGQSLLWFLLPLAFSLGVTHSLVPPHPGIVGAVNVLGAADPGRVMVETILFGTLLSVPLILIGWLGPGRFWAARQFVAAPAGQEGDTSVPAALAPPPAFGVAVLIVVMPLVLSLLGFGARLLDDLQALPAWMKTPLIARTSLPDYLAFLSHSPLTWLQFLGKPVVALLTATALAYWLLGRRRGMNKEQLGKLTGLALNDVGAMLFLFGAAGGFKEIIQASGAGAAIAHYMSLLPLSPVAGAYFVSVLVRIALGSATAAILTASAVLAGVADTMPGIETLLVLAVACGVTFMTQPADSGFWMIKEFGRLSVRDVMLRLNGCRILMSLSGLAILLVVEALIGPVGKLIGRF